MLKPNPLKGRSMKLYSRYYLLFFVLFDSYGKVLITYPSSQVVKKNFIKRTLENELKIPKELVDYQKQELCRENEKYDMVICLNNKKGELTFPTFKKNLVQKKYEIFLKK